MALTALSSLSALIRASVDDSEDGILEGRGEPGPTGTRKRIKQSQKQTKETKNSSGYMRLYIYDPGPNAYDFCLTEEFRPAPDSFLNILEKSMP
jgi:hypothetical protein